MIHFVTYAQNFEDLMLWRALHGVQNGFYIDVGAADPDEDTVTRAFYDHGWHGVNIEPSPEHFAAISAARPRDVNLSCLVGRSHGVRQFYNIKETGLSTTKKDWAKSHAADGYPSEVIRRPVRTLADICREYAPPNIHFLKIDVEGAEEEVLRGADFTTYRPWIVLVEATMPNSRVENWQTWDPLLTKADYRFVWFDGLNRFYLASERAEELSQAFLTPPNVFDYWVRPRGPQQIAFLKEVHALLATIERLREEATVTRANLEAEAMAARSEAQAGRAEANAARAETDAARAEASAVQAAMDRLQEETTMRRGSLVAEAMSARHEAQVRGAEANAARAEANALQVAMDRLREETTMTRANLDAEAMAARREAQAGRAEANAARADADAARADTGAARAETDAARAESDAARADADAARADADAARADTDAARADTNAARAETDAARADADAARTDADAARAETDAARADADAARAEADAARADADAARAEASALLTSTSWKITAPLRALSRGLFNPARRQRLRLLAGLGQEPAAVKGLARIAIDGPGHPRVARDEVVRAARRWLFDVLLPFWCDVGFDRRLGAFVEQLSTDGSVTPLEFKRVRVQTRQIYVYSHAAILGFSGPALECAMRAFEFLKQHAWSGTGAGWGRTMGADGGLRDATPDLYDNAFVLFGLAWLYQATGDRDVKKWIDRTGDAIEEVFADKDHGGYWHAKPPSGWREQNPLMHLLEAYLAAFQATKDDRWFARAGELVALAESRLFDRETGTLAELYASDWSRAPAGLGDRIEPGHHFEWFWLLDWYARSRAIQIPDIAETLFVFAERYGVDRVSGLTYDSISSAGRPIDRSTRCWPQCETIKARVVRGQRFGSQDLHLADCAVDNFLHRFVAPAPPGTWIEHFDPEGRSKAERIPASSVYHIVLALSAYLQEDRLETRSVV